MIRKAVMEDMDALLRMSEEFIKEAPYTVPYDEETCRENFTNVINAQEKDVVLLVGIVDNEVVGMFSGIHAPLYYNKNYSQASEWFWWVDVEHRNTTIGKELFEDYEDWAKFYGAHQINCCTMSSNKSLVGWFEKKGYTNKEFFCSKEVA